jgi:hypothetical protein
MAAVNSAPIPTVGGELTLDRLIAGASRRVTTTAPGRHPAGGRWSAAFDTQFERDERQPTPPTPRLLVCELVDAAVQRRAADHPWENRNGATNFARHAVPVATATLPLK